MNYPVQKFVRNLRHVHMYVDTYTTMKHVSHIYTEVQHASALTQHAVPF
jgi:hypothetical protein